MPGRNVRMPEFSALLGWLQLSHLNEYLARRREIALSYISHFDKIREIDYIKLESIEQSSFWKTTPGHFNSFEELILEYIKSFEKLRA